ncbi:zinc finger CCCH domain-containing protein 20-like [Typha latifolia]|uniref:zinc finger CCCH domain-containing protein 20-like n=1 Tax=Typha latifolia TaxID=4733 RepID=UPI003C2EE7DA
MMLHNATVDIPPWSPFSDLTAEIPYPSPVSGVTAGDCSAYLLSALHRQLADSSSYSDSDESDSLDAYACDEFRMYEFKIRRCARGRSHDWTECPYAHPGEKARRRDPRRYHYAGTPCPDFRKGGCKRGDACEFAHGVFETWLHPARYRTQPCKDGTSCRRRVCFFAHTPEQLRVLPQQQQHSPRSPRGESYDGSPLRRHSVESPPVSPSMRRASVPAASGMNEVLASLRQLQIGKAQSVPASWGMEVGGGGRGLFSSPSTPTAAGEEERESGRELRAKMFERLCKESVMAPDVGWVSELVN